jgi:hypothetical protein
VRTRCSSNPARPLLAWMLFLDGPSAADDLDQGWQRDVSGAVAAVEGQFPGAAVATDQQPPVPQARSPAPAGQIPLTRNEIAHLAAHQHNPAPNARALDREPDSTTACGVPPTFRTADPLGSSAERMASGVREIQEVLS